MPVLSMKVTSDRSTVTGPPASTNGWSAEGHLPPQQTCRSLLRTRSSDSPVLTPTCISTLLLADSDVCGSVIELPGGSVCQVPCITAKWPADFSWRAWVERTYALEADSWTIGSATVSASSMNLRTIGGRKQVLRGPVWSSFSACDGGPSIQRRQRPSRPLSVSPVASDGRMLR